MDLALLWLWHRLADTALNRCLAWEHPYTTVVALKKTKDKKYENIHVMFIFLINIENVTDNNKY